MAIYSQENYYKGYRNQVAYIDDQMEKAVTTLLADSPNPPIIIMQGDHGPWLQTGSDQFKILNAYYLPGHNDAALSGHFTGQYLPADI